MRKYRGVLWKYSLILILGNFLLFLSPHFLLNISSGLSNSSYAQAARPSSSPTPPPPQSPQDKNIERLENETNNLKKQIEDRFGLTNFVITTFVAILSVLVAILALFPFVVAVYIFVISSRVIKDLSEKIEQKFQSDVEQISKAKMLDIEKKIEKEVAIALEAAKDDFQNKVAELSLYLQCKAALNEKLQRVKPQQKSRANNELKNDLKQLYQKIRELEKSNSKVCSATASAYFRDGEGLLVAELYEEAIDSYRESINLEQSNQQAFTGKAYAFLQLKKYQDSIDSCDSAIQLNPEFARALHIKGLAQAGLQMYEEALKSYEEAISYEDNASFFVNAGIASLKLGNCRQAIDYCNRALEISPTSAEAFYNLACAYALTNEVEKAIEFLRKAMDLNDRFRRIARRDSDLEAIRDHDWTVRSSSLIEGRG